MGDIVKGLYGGGTSGSIGAGRGNIKQKNTYLGENANQRPLEDIMGRLAGEANQQLAQRNLLFGGPGYGGSFESNDQVAARAADPNNPLPAKKYGGWGGYGSQNPTLGGQETNGYVPPGTPPPAPPTPPPGGGSSAPIPSPDGGGPIIQPGGPGSLGGGPLPPGGTGPKDDTRPPVSLPPGGGTPIPAPAPAPYDKTNPSISGGQLDPRQEEALQLAAKRHGWSPQEIEYQRSRAAGRPTNQTSAEYLRYANQGSVESLKRAGRMDEANALQSKLNSPEYKGFLEVQDFLSKKGDVQGVREPDVVKALQSGLTVDDLKKHFGTILDQMGPEAFSVGHTILGQLNNLDPENIAKIKSGAAAQEAVTGRPQDGLIPGTAPAAGGPNLPPVAGGSPTNPPGPGKPIIQGKSTTTPPQALASNVAATPDYSAYGKGVEDDPNNGGDPEVEPTGGRGDGTDGGDGSLTGNPEWDAYLAPYAAQIRDTYNRMNGGGGGGHINQDGDWVPDGFDETNDPPGGAYSNQDTDNPQRASQFGPQGFNPTKVQKRNADGSAVVDEKGNPVYEDMQIGQAYPDAGYAGGDAWSTSPLWRPEEPQGGLYGAYTDLASGNLTDYENRNLQGWEEMTKKAGRGEDEAYGAYGDMLKGGYSPAEQNAITQEGMKAARAGFETNRDAMLRNQARTGNSAGYAANMAKMARGFSETMGSQGRQNQIDFANETQKRKETGASGMLNVAGLGQARKTTGLQGQQSAMGYGRDLQSKGLSGLHALYTGQDPSKQWATAAGVASNPRETYTESGNASL